MNTSPSTAGSSQTPASQTVSSTSTPTSTSTPSPSGTQWRIASGRYAATIVEVGGALRELTFDGRDIIAGYHEDEVADAARGNLLVPWPNRIRDGKYSFAGRDFQLPLNEAKLRNASHGLARWANFQLVEHGEDFVRVGLTMYPSSGWAWTLRFEVEYRLSAEGLTITPFATNLSNEPCPFGFGAHPYLTTGEDNLDEVTVTTHVSQEITLDERLLPTGVAPARYDYTGGLNLTGVNLDVCYTDPALGADGVWDVVVARGEQRVRLWAHAAYGYLQMFTGDGLPAKRRRKGLAVEPMTCPANAFNSGEGLITLEPGQTWSAPFGIQVPA